MTEDATPVPAYRFGDLLALARRSWTLAMARELELRGYSRYRISDAASMRLLLAGPLPIGRLAAVLGVSRQAARKVARGLEERGLATTQVDPADARKLNVVLTDFGESYAMAVVDVIEALNRRVAAQVSATSLEAADTVLRSAITEGDLRRSSQSILPPARDR